MRTHKPVPVSLTQEMQDYVNRRAKALGVSRSAFVQQLIRRDAGQENILEATSEQLGKKKKSS